MPKVAIYNLAGEQQGDLELTDKVFAVPGNDALLHQVFVSISANNRSVIAHTKDRSERAGSGKKPFRQKGTGGARGGSVRSPLWRKGGVTFGPTKDRNFKKDINKKMKRKATMIALSEKVKNDNFKVIDNITPKEQKTKSFAAAFGKLKLAGKVLVAFSEQEQGLRRYCRNIRNTSVTLTKDLNVHDLLGNKMLVLSKDSVAQLEKQFGGKEVK